MWLVGSYIKHIASDCVFFHRKRQSILHVGQWSDECDLVYKINHHYISIPLQERPFFDSNKSH